MEDKLIPIESVSGRLEAELLKSMLEANGIQCHLSQEAVGGVYGLTVGPFASVELLVQASQKEAALEIIQDYYTAQGEDKESQ